MRLDFSKFSENQISNLKAAIDAYNQKKVTSCPSPPVLYVELTKNCPARCAFCRGNKWNNDASHNMQDEIFNIVLRDYIPYAVIVDLRGWGESLMLPKFAEYIYKTASYGPKIRLTTNLGCENKKALEAIIDNDVFVSISIDAAEKDVYEQIREGINFDLMIRNLEFLAEGFIKKYGSVDDRIRFGIVPLQKKNLDQVKKIIKLAEKYKISNIRFVPLFASPTNKNLLIHNKRKTLKMLRECVDLLKIKNMSLQLGFTLFPSFCFKEKIFDRCCHPWFYAAIDAKGYIGHCDHFIGRDKPAVTAGHVSQNKSENWNGSVMQEQRLIHLNKDKDKLYSSCWKCYSIGRHADHEYEIDDQFERWHVTEQDIEKKLNERNWIDKIGDFI